MSNLKIFVNASEIASAFGELRDQVEQAVIDATQRAAAMTYTKVVEISAEKLRSRLETYQDALSYREVTPGIWVVELDESAMWIEEGRSSGSMVPDLLAKNPKIAKDGTRYKVIPFEHSKGPAKQSEKAQAITALLKKELKNRKIPFKKTEYGEDGAPKTGKLHSFNIASPKPSAMAKHGSLMGVNIYQRRLKNNKIRRDIMTFRVVTDKHQQEGLWYHPGLVGVKILDEAFEWIQNELDTKILPELLKGFE